MATQEITGTIKLADRILSDARADAAKTSGEAQETMNAIRAESEKALSAKKAEFAAKRDAAVASVLDGCKTRAALDGRKSALKKKREVIDEAFSRAYDEIAKLSEQQRAQICLHLLQSEAEDGEVIRPAPRDRDVMKQILADYREYALTMSDADAEIDGGFLLVNTGYEKDCSFRSLLADLRSSEETNVANLLFNAKGGQS